MAVISVGATIETATPLWEQDELDLDSPSPRPKSNHCLAWVSWLTIFVSIAKVIRETRQRVNALWLHCVVVVVVVVVFGCSLNPWLILVTLC